MTAEEEMAKHADEVTDLMTLYAIDNLVGQCDRVADLLEERTVIDLDMVEQLRKTRRSLNRFRNRNF